MKEREFTKSMYSTRNTSVNTIFCSRGYYKTFKPFATIQNENSIYSSFDRHLHSKGKTKKYYFDQIPKFNPKRVTTMENTNSTEKIVYCLLILHLDFLCQQRANNTTAILCFHFKMLSLGLNHLQYSPM